MLSRLAAPDLLHPAQRKAFLSYARADVAFAERLDAALRDAGRTTWIDRSGIEPTEEWLAAIHAGIDRSDNFVLIVTPRSIASPWCAKEVEYAAARNKRLIPLLAAATDPASLPPLIASRQWIDCTAGFDAGFADLLEALDRDLSYVHEHTRLLGRAIDWKNGEGGLLGRAEVKTAERWLAEARADPAPTPLHNEFIVSSGQAVTRALRRIIAGAVFAVVVSLTLAVLAFLQRNEARRQTEAATQNLANTLAARAAGNAKPRQALCGAVSALDTAITPATLDALLRVLQRTDQLRAILDPAAGAAHMRGLTVDGDALVVAAAPYVSDVEWWDLRSGRHTVTQIQGGVMRVPLAVSGGLIATRGAVWRAGEANPVFELEGAEPHALALAGTERIAAARDDVLEVCPLRGGACVSTAAPNVTRIAFAGSGAQWLVTAAGTELAVRDVATLGVLRSRSITARVRAMAGSTSTPEVALILADGTVCTLDAANASCDCAQDSSDDNFTFRNVARIYGAGPIDESLVAVSGDGRLLAVTNGEQIVGLPGIDVSIAVWDSSRSRGELAPLRHIVNGSIAAVSPDGSRIVLRKANGHVALADPSGVAPEGRLFKPAGRVLACTPSVIVAAGDGVTLHDATGAVIARLPGNPVTAAAFSGDGTRLAIVARGNVRVYRVPSGEPVGKELTIGSRKFVLVAGSRSLLTFDGESLDEWNLDTGVRVPRPLRGPASGWDDDDAQVNVLAASPDGRRIATYGGGYGEGMTPRLVLWDLARGTVIASQALTDATGDITTIAFGEELIVAGDTMALRLFDARTLAPVGEPIALDTSVTLDGCSAHLSADRKYASLACDRRTVTFKLDPQEWRRVALGRAGPNACRAAAAQ